MACGSPEAMTILGSQEKVAGLCETFTGAGSWDRPSGAKR
jgi:hypothetical protein